jgi:hypothetical protein
MRPLEREYILTLFPTGDLATELGHVLQPGDGTLDSGQRCRARVSVQHDQEHQLDGKPQLLEWGHPTGLQRLVELVRRRDRAQGH